MIQTSGAAGAERADGPWDVIVIGGGPAGSAAAAVLAEKGRRVVLLEKERFPRYHIGESLIPHCWFPLQRLGLVERLDAAGFAVHKHSVQFVRLDGHRYKPFYFFEHSEHDSSRTWQVVRAEFDQMLLDNAREKGAHVLEGTAVKELVSEGGAVVGVRAQGEGGAGLELRAPVTVDASGRDALTQARQRWRVFDERLRKVALWTYYRGAVRDPGVDGGATTIAYLPGKGWFWYIPLAGDVVSVGVVAEADYLYGETRDPETVFLREVERQAWIREHLAPGVRCDGFRTTGEFTYRARHCAAGGLVLAGDALGFLDPVFSSGVYLALQGGVLAADTIDAALAEGDVSASRFEGYAERYLHSMEAMRRLVHAFYDTAFSFGDFLRAHPDMRGDMTDVLIGNLSRDFDAFFAAMGRFADLPAPLPHGRPLAGPLT